MSSTSGRDASLSIAIGGFMALIVAAIALLVVNWSGTFPRHAGDLVGRHVTVVNAILAAMIAVAWQGSGAFFGLYECPGATLVSKLIRVLECSVAVAGVLAIYLIKWERGPRVPRVLAVFLCLVVLCESIRLICEGFLIRKPNRVVIVGGDRLAAKAWRGFRVGRCREMQLVGFVDDHRPDDLLPDMAARYLGKVHDLPRVVVEHAIDDVIVAISIGSDSPDAERPISLAGSLGARILCVKDVCGIRPDSIAADYGDLFFELVPAPRLRGIGQAAKRAFDVAFSIVGLAAGMPMLAVAFVIGVLRGRRLLFRKETRLGFRRKPYKTYRLCICPGGHRIKLCLAQLPVLWNVLRGDMSLVGPAPLCADEVVGMQAGMLSGRFNLRPGLTGRLEVERNAEPAAVHRSTYWSFRTDIKMLAKALRVMTQRPQVETSAGAL